MQEEHWKNIDGYEGDYMISNIGRIKVIKTFMKKSNVDYLKPRLTHNGYLNVTLRKIGVKRIEVRIHRIVAKQFIENLENKPQVNHINGIKTDNRMENLEWCTNKENTKHAWDNGLHENTRAAMRMRTKRRHGFVSYNAKTVFNPETGIYYTTANEAWLYSDKKISRYSFYTGILGHRNSINKTKYILA